MRDENSQTQSQNQVQSLNVSIQDASDPVFWVRLRVRSIFVSSWRKASQPINETLR